MKQPTLVGKIITKTQIIMRRRRRGTPRRRSTRKGKSRKYSSYRLARGGIRL